MKLFLIDGHALIFKMYYAFLGRPMVNSKGVDTSILFGFTKYLLELIEKERPTHLAVSFDPPGGTFRNRLYPGYKANRPETPQLVIDALEPLMRILKAMDIPVLMIPDYEADDVIGSMAKRSVAEGMDVYMVTPDKDYGQLIEDHIIQYRPGKAGSDNELIDVAAVCAKWNISSPSQVTDVLTICGDSADNVPGVQGVGPVGAAKLLGRYGSVEGIYDHLEELSPRQRELFEAARDHISLSKDLVTIKTDIPLETTAQDMVYDMKLTPELLAVCDEFEFFSLKKKLPSICVSVQNDSSALTGSPVVTGSSAVTGSPALTPPVAVTLTITEVPPSIIDGERIALILMGDFLYVSDGRNVARGAIQDFSGILADKSVAKCAAGVKSLLNALAENGIEMVGRMYDVELMHYLLNPERSHTLESLASNYLGVELEEGSCLATGCLFDDDSGTDSFYAFRRVIAVRLITDRLLDELRTSGLDRLYDTMEEPLVKVLSLMERTGVKIDMESLGEYASGLRAHVMEKERLVRELAGEPGLNVSSPKQIGEVLFGKLKLDPGAKKPKSGNWPTDEQTLSELSDRSPIIDAILEYRGAKKLLSTYIEPLPSYISPRDGRVHTCFNQALTATGRLSSSNPNLQNIPVRTEQGREIRKAFVAGLPGYVMMSADYSQIELRVMAHLCGDNHLCEAFRNGIDVHSATAAKIFRIPVEQVTSEQRRVAKTANFGIMYGISSFGLSQRLKCSRSEAKQIIDDYFESFPSIRGFIDETLADARREGYVQTIFGRRRYVPDLNSHNANIRAVAERNAVNAPIQGTAADIIKLAMCSVFSSLMSGGYKSRMVLQIHDELLLEVPEEEIETTRDILVHDMENVVKLAVPLTVECNYGYTWLEAH